MLDKLGYIAIGGGVIFVVVIVSMQEVGMYNTYIYIGLLGVGLMLARCACVLKYHVVHLQALG